VRRTINDNRRYSGKKRITFLQEEINTLAAMLPEHAQIAFGRVYITKPTMLAHRKRLVLAIKEVRLLE